MLQHAWKQVDQYEGSPYEERFCGICHLKDIRSQDGGRWKVGTPCIERVPKTISYDRLIREIFQFVEDKRKAQELLNRIRCIGVPGAWAVGIVLNGYVTYPEHKELYKDFEAGFAEVLRWLRARQFNLYQYSDLAYREQLAKPSYNPADED